MRWSGATWKGDGISGGSYLGSPDWKVVIHTTETRGLPGYNGGRYAPHFTYMPDRGLFIQHTDTNVAARALRNASGGNQTNRDHAIQLEVVCYSARGIAIEYGGTWVGELPPVVYREIAEWIRWVNQHHPIKYVWPGRQALSYAQANASGFRLTGTDWDTFNGICGHQHVDENTHWDPGAFDWNALMTELEGEEPMANILQRGAEGPAVRKYQKALITFYKRRGVDALPVFGADADFGSETEEWVILFQGLHGLPDISGRIDGVTAGLLSPWLFHGDPADEGGGT